ncbi:MAG TPA: hypothetical protein GX497_10110 [Bacillus bacterium]|nr:hypothetical protein [Bacillus sp. (in: firmicutes)]
METEINTIKTSLSEYKNRQAILNYYEDEELVQRDGLDFETIHVTGSEIQFLVGDRIKETINLSQYKTFERSTEFFKNYYELKNGANILRIYFP